MGDQVLHQTKRVPAQVVRVGRTGGCESHREEARQAVQPVGQSHDQAGPASGRCVPCKAGQVMFKDRIGHGRGLARLQAILPPHHSLQAGELDHHLGPQVSLAQMSRPPGDFSLLLAQSQHSGELVHELLQPMGLVQHRAQLFLEGESRQPRQKRVQRLLYVLAVEKVGVGEPGPDDLLVAMAHRVQVLVAPVADGDKTGQQLAICAHNGKVPLMLLHYRDEYLSRQLQIFLLKASQEGGRLFDQVRDLVQQCRVVGNAPAHAPGQFCRTRGDEGAPLLDLGHDVVIGEQPQIVACLGDVDLGGTIWPGTPAGAATGDAGVLEGNYRVAQQGHQPAQGPGESNVAPIPPHALLEAQAGDQFGQQCGQHLGGRPALLAPECHHVLAAVYCLCFQLPHAHALLAGKPCGCLRRVALGVKSHAHRWTLYHLFDWALVRCQTLHVHHQSPGGAQCAQARVFEPRLRQAGWGQVAQLRQCVVQVARGQLLRTNFQQQGFRFQSLVFQVGSRTWNLRLET